MEIVLNNTNETLIAWGTITLATLTIFIIIVGYIQLRQIIHNQKLNTLSQYLTRYNSIISKIPIEYFYSNFIVENLNDEKRKELLQLMFDYWNLIAEEFMFKRRGWIDQIIWDGWEKGILDSLNKHNFFIWSWNEISKFHRYNRVLVEFMIEQLKKQKVTQ